MHVNLKSGNAGNAPQISQTALVHRSSKGENAENEIACKRPIETVVSKSRNPKLHVSRGLNAMNLIEIDMGNNWSWKNRSSFSQPPPSYCVPLIRRSSDHYMVYLYSPRSRQSNVVHEQGVVPKLLFPHH